MLTIILGDCLNFWRSHANCIVTSKLIFETNVAIIEWGWVGYEEFCRSRRVLSMLMLYYSFKIYPRSWRSFAISLFVFPLTKIIQSCPQVFSVNGSILCSGLHFWRHFDVIGSKIFSGLHFWRHWFNIWWTAAGCGEICVRF